MGLVNAVGDDDVTEAEAVEEKEEKEEKAEEEVAKEWGGLEDDVDGVVLVDVLKDEEGEEVELVTA